MVPFNENRFHYNWHWFWDTGNGETGNNGPHMVDMARHILKKREHPKTRHEHGRLGRLCGHPGNAQFAAFVDGVRRRDARPLEVRGLYTNAEDKITMGLLVYGSEGWMHLGLTSGPPSLAARTSQASAVAKPKPMQRPTRIKSLAATAPSTMQTSSMQCAHAKWRTFTRR